MKLITKVGVSFTDHVNDDELNCLRTYQVSLPCGPEEGLLGLD